MRLDEHQMWAERDRLRAEAQAAANADRTALPLLGLIARPRKPGRVPGAVLLAILAARSGTPGWSATSCAPLSLVTDVEALGA